MLSLTLLSLLAPASPQIPTAIIVRGKLATAYAIAQPARGSGTAFHIGHGLFVTNSHVVDPARADPPVKLVLNAGEENVRELPATVVRKDKEHDLALLRVKEAVPTALDLGASDRLMETETVVAFGYPFGAGLALRRGEHPGITVTIGRISALRRSKGVLQEIQIDAALNPGNSGGPVLDAAGQVIGIVQAGVPGSGLNFAIPVDLLRTFLSAPDIEFEAPSLHGAPNTVPLTVTARATPILPGGGPLSMTVTLTPGDGKPREIAATPLGGDRFVIKIPSLPVTVLSTSVELGLEEGGITSMLTVEDCAFTVAGKSARLSEALDIDMQAKSVKLRDGRKLTGQIAGLSAVETKLGVKRVPVDLISVPRVQVSNVVTTVSPVAYKLVVRQGGAVAGELSGVFK